MPVHMPFADVGSVVTCGRKRLSNARGSRLQIDIVHEDAVGQRSLSGEQTSPVRGANRISGQCVGEVNAFSSQRIEVRRLHIGIAGIADSLLAPLITENKYNVWFLHSSFCKCPLSCVIYMACSVSL